MPVSRYQINSARGTVSAPVYRPLTIRVCVLARPGRAVGAVARSGVAVTSFTGCWRRAAYNISAPAMGGFSLARRCSREWGSGT